MTWQAPEFLLLLWLVPVLAVLQVWEHRRRSRSAERFFGAEMARRLLPAAGATRRWARNALVLGGLALVSVAAARPGFGVYYEQVTTRGTDLVICLDVSRSMLATDVAPNRLERARSDVLDLLERVEGDRVGLILFAGRPVTACPLTSDQAFFRLALKEAGPHSAPRGGSLIGDALRAALGTLEARPDRDQAVVLITDGEDQESAPLEAAKQAAERGVKVFAVGIGDSEEGARIPVETAAGEVVYLKYEGQEVWSRLDRTLLAEMALQTGGAYVDAGTRAYDLGAVYDQHLADLARGELDTEKRKRHHERYQWFAGLGLALLAAHLLLRDHDRAPEALALEAGG